MFVTFRIENDCDMYDSTIMETCKCLDFTIHEELGDVDYIFTDKTGTLTANILTFRGCSASGNSYMILEPKEKEELETEIRNQVQKFSRG